MLFFSLHFNVVSQNLIVLLILFIQESSVERDDIKEPFTEVVSFTVRSYYSTYCLAVNFDFLSTMIFTSFAKGCTNIEI